MDTIEELLTRGVANIIPNRGGLESVLRSGGKLNVYLGIDPTATKIHLGHAVPLRKLRLFAQLGHNVTFLIGDFTALIGDTSDKESERPILTTEQIKKNFQTYKEQAEKILDFSKVSVRYNSEWLKNLSFEEIITLYQHFSFGDFASRELIRKRLREGKHVGLHEALYPVMQGYDSYYMDTDVQVGGTDQTFNMQAGRILQRALRGKESYILTNVFLEGTDGKKMSKTWENAIWISDNPNDMFAKVMAIRDDLIIQYYMLATNVPIETAQAIQARLSSQENPMEAKKELAKTIVRELHSNDDAKLAQEHFEKVVQQKEVPEEIPDFRVPENFAGNISDALVAANLATSKAEAKRLVEQRGVAIDNKVVSDPNAPFIPKEGSILQVGKRKFARIVPPVSTLR